MKFKSKIFGVFAIALLSASCSKNHENTICSSASCSQNDEIMDKVLRNSSIDQVFSIPDTLPKSCNIAMKNHEREQYESSSDWTESKLIDVTNDSISLSTTFASPITQCNGANMDFISARLDTNNKFIFTLDDEKKPILKGGVEVTASLPFTKGLWPAIWMLPNLQNWPTGMEFDIAEYQHLAANDPAHSVKLGSHVHYGLNVEDKKKHPDPNDPDVTKTTWNFNGNGADNLTMPIITENDPIHPSTKHVYGFTWSCSGTDFENLGNCDLGWYLDGKQYLWMHFVDPSHPSQDKAYISDDGGQTKINLKQHAFSNWSVAPNDDNYSAYQSLKAGLKAGYYLIINTAVGGAGITDKNNQPDFAYFKNNNAVANLKVYSIKRHIMK